MVCISLQLAEKPSAAGVLNDQEGRLAGSAHRQAKHGAIDPELLNDAVDFGANGVMSGVAWLSSRFTHRCSTGSRRL